MPGQILCLWSFSNLPAIVPVTTAPSPPTTEVHTADTWTVHHVPPQRGLAPSSGTSCPWLLRKSIWIVGLLSNTSETAHQKSWPAWPAPSTFYNLKVLGLKCTSCLRTFPLPGPSLATRRLLSASPDGVHLSKLSESSSESASQRLSICRDTSLLYRKRPLPPASPHVSLTGLRTTNEYLYAFALNQLMDGKLLNGRNHYLRVFYIPQIM